MYWPTLIGQMDQLLTIERMHQQLPYHHVSTTSIWSKCSIYESSDKEDTQC